jgi:hypothetical protein
LLLIHLLMRIIIGDVVAGLMHCMTLRIARDAGECNIKAALG